MKNEKGTRYRPDHAQGTNPHDWAKCQQAQRNMRRFMFQSGPGRRPAAKWARQFMKWLERCLARNRSVCLGETVIARRNRLQPGRRTLPSCGVKL